jgi:hypoxanthine phosphoribosyltransferase
MEILYRSVEYLNQTIIKHLSIFPHDVELIVGIPRSGMLPANLLALYLNKPYTDIDSFVEDRIYKSGSRGQYFNQDKIHNVLVIDDWVASGKALAKAKDKVKDIIPKYNIVYGTIYINAENTHLVDFYCEKHYHGTLVMQWNLFLYPSLLKDSCFDIDGVMCIQPPIDDDGSIYFDYLNNAIPLYLPVGQIDTVVTCRLEKYRNVTEQWLKKWGVRYKNLIMLDLPNKEARALWKDYGIYKGTIYKKRKLYPFCRKFVTRGYGY